MTLFLIDAVIKASILFAAAAATTTLLRRSSAASRHLVWTVALLAALALPALSIALPRWQFPLITVAPAPAVATTPVDDAASRSMAARLLERLEAPGPSTPSPSAEAGAAAVEPARLSLSWSRLAGIAWMAGAALILGRLLLGLVAVQVLSRRTVDATDARWMPLARELAAGLGVSNVVFRRSAHASMPMAWGIWRASVSMPLEADRWSEERLRIVLLHELAHVKRRDCLTHVLAQVACAFYWFNPLAWMAARRVRAERERACDDLVLAAGTPGPDYADQLLEIARVMRAGRFSSVAAGASLAMAQRSQLEGRLMAILDPSVPRTGVSRVRGLAASALAAVALLPLASVQAWTTADQLPPSPAPAPVVAPAPVSVPAPAPAPAPAPEPNAVMQSPDTPREGVKGTVRGGVAGGIQEGVRAGIAGGVAGGIDGGISGSLASIVNDVVRDTVPAVVDSVVSAAAEDQDAKRTADPKVVAALTAALKDTDKDVRQTALQALVRLRDPGIFEPLLQALKDGAADVREQAAFGLGQMRDKRAVEPLMDAVRDTAPNVREQAVFALGQLRDSRAVEPLISALKDSHANVREQAAFALGQLRASAAVEALVVAIKDSSASVRQQVAFALGQIRDPRAIDALTTALKDAHADVRQQAAFALGQLAR